ncbi:MAG: hypothetical protein RI101_05370 [Nitrospira sp.]|jgi:hypothetical protein|nr:hypothetical protein [Nitrospira sp.]
MSLGDLLDQVDPLSVTGRVAQVIGLVIEGCSAAFRARGHYVV